MVMESRSVSMIVKDHLTFIEIHARKSARTDARVVAAVWYWNYNWY